MARQENVLQRINTELEEGWEATLDQSGRICYINHKSQTTSWLPPRENWDSNTGLPYGWETGIDRNDKEYYINHVDRYTTRDDPRLDPDYVDPPRPRDVELLRDPEKGFGFVAGSEKPVVVRFVTEGGPSEDKLLPGDQILKINGEEVRRAPREKVIELVRSCKQAIVLTVCQPYTDNSTRKSALLTAAKKAKLKNNPSRVRFADAVLVNGTNVINPSPVESYVPFMPNVLKVFLENGQTKSFKYDNKTTVKDVVVSLQEKLNIRCANHFSLVVQNMKTNTGTAAKMTLLQEHESLAEIAARPGARHFRCLFRVTFVPRDAYDLLKEDPIAFEYFYLQCCNDVLHERFASEMKYDTALRLAALHIQQHALSNTISSKFSIKTIIKECGLDKFVSKSLLDSMKGKDLKRMLAQYMKTNQSLAAPGQKHLTALQAKLHYMKIISELKTFGSRVFMVTLLDKKTEAMLLVGPNSGISIVTNIKSYQLSKLAEFGQIESVKVTKDGENMQRVDIKLKGHQSEIINLGLLTEDSQNFISMVAGYFRLLVDPEKRIVERTMGKNTTDPDVPTFESVHRVLPAPWSYPEDLVSEVVMTSGSGVSDNQKVVDLSHDPPEYVENQEYLARIKQDLGNEAKLIDASRDVTDSRGLTDFDTDLSAPAQPQPNGSTFSQFEEGVTSFGVVSHGSNSFNSLSTSQALRKVPISLSNQPVFNATIDLRKTPVSANVGQQVADKDSSPPGFSEAERSSDTDSLSAVDTEKRPLLGQTAQQNGNLRNSLDMESDDTDSFGTPSSSPAKVRVIQRVSSVESGMHSFGLHSPDMLPAADVDFRQMSDSDIAGLPPEVYNAIYNPGYTISAQKLYFDPDIIDLTMFLPSDVPGDDDSMIDFTALPPPSFTNSSPLVFKSPDSSLPSLADYGSVSHPLQTSSSSGDFFQSDIDSLIAQYYVPPPPSSADSSSLHSQVVHQGFDETAPLANHSQNSFSKGVGIDEDFSSLIIPPPPPSVSNVEEISVVPPVPLEAVKEKRKRYTHKRSSSVDIGALNLAKSQLEKADAQRSLDSQQQNEQREKPIQKENGSNRMVLLRDLDGTGGLDPDSHDGLATESPATVSLKLHNLLRSLPNFVPEASLVGQQHHQQHSPFMRTGSLRIPRSSSLDRASSTSPSIGVSQNGSAIPRTWFSGTSSLSRLSGRKAISHEGLFLGDERTSRQSGSILDNGPQQTQMPTEGFASLKAKLKDYRDSLLKRTSNSRKNSTSEDTASDGSTGEKGKKGSLKRSNSFNRLLMQLSGKQGNKSSSKGSEYVVGDGNWTLKQRSPDDSSRPSADLRSLFTPPASEWDDPGAEKRTPVVRETFAVPRSSLRPVSNTPSSQTQVSAAGDEESLQSKSKKSGPLKALSSVFTGEENGGSGSAASAPHSKKQGKSSASKDDLSMMRSGKKKDKSSTNPYATIKIWRPISMASSVSIDDESAYHTFTSFDVPIADSKLPATGDLRNANSTSSNCPEVPAVAFGDEADRNALSSPGFAKDISFSSLLNSSQKLSGPALIGSNDESGDRTVPGRNSLRSPSPTLNGLAELNSSSFSTSGKPAVSQASDDDSNPQHRRSRPANRSSKIPVAVGAQTMNGGADIPTDYSRDSSPASSSNRFRSLSADRSDSSERRGQSISLSSFSVVNPVAAESVKDVLAKTYGPEGFEMAQKDVDKMLSRFKETMDSLKTLQASTTSSPSQFQTVKQELLLQTRQFVNDAKCLVSTATGARKVVAAHLNVSMHTLARLFLHGQALMVRMSSVHHAQHLGIEMLKVSNSFKSTVAAANAAIDKPLDDPHVKYLMRQATNLAGLLSMLLKSLKTLEQT